MVEPVTAVTEFDGNSLVSDAVIPIHTAEDDPIGGAYGTWAVGGDYKASFHELPTFIPYLGADYPVTRRLGFDTRSITVGGVELLSASEAMREHTDTRYEIHRDGVVEAYDVLVKGLEQTFTFTEPLGPGDLVITCVLDSNLEMREVRGTPASVDFFDDSGDRVLNYGEALVFDAHGRSAAVETVAAGGEIKLRVNAVWLEDATYPVVVDPLVTVTMLATGNTLTAMDSVASDFSDSSLVCYARAASATDNDLVVRRLPSFQFNRNSTVFADATTSWSSDDPQLSSARGFPVDVVVAFSRFFTNRVSAVRLVGLDGASTSLSTSVVFVSNPAGQQTWRPDVGGVLDTTSGTHMLLAYQMEAGTQLMNTATSGIGGRVLDVSGAFLTVGPAFTIAAGANFDCERPSVNQFARGNGLDTTWVAAYQCYNNSIPGDDWDVNARQVNGRGQVSSATWFPTNSNGATPSHRLAPKIAGRNGRYGVVFTRSTLGGTNFKTQRNNGHTIEFERLTWATGSSSFTRFPCRSHTPYLNTPLWRLGHLGFDRDSRSHWVYSSLALSSQNGSGSAYFVRAGYQGIAMRSVRVQAILGDCIAGGVTYENDPDTMVVSYGLARSNTAYIARLSYPAPSDRVATTVRTCGAASIDWTGTGNARQQIGSEFWGVQVTGAPTSAVHLMLLSLEADNQLLGPGVEPGCRLLVSLGSGYIGILPLQVGSNVIFPFPLPEALDPVTLLFQDFHTNPAGDLFQNTARMHVPLAK